MDQRNDYLLRLIKKLVEMLAKAILGKESVDQTMLDQILAEGCGFDLEPLQQFPHLIKQMILLTGESDENKKALAIISLFLKDKQQYEAICREILETMRWNLLHQETQNLLRQVFNQRENS